ncbi:uncharacterized protein LOC127755186 [Oryza glaberrima]|uniref:Uncharacterized protein n=2 Tax=Oryza TaxID=4527 RepID=A0A0D3HHF2_9ORYZ|nr:uncharacterized protein LOC127755186 [Oryza glaberrima]
MATLFLSSNKKQCSSSSLLLLVLLLLLVFFAQHGSCSRPLLLPSPTPMQPQLKHESETASADTTTTTEEQVVQQQQLSWLRSMKPRGRPQPSSPSKRTN